jgi:hypothetical protein
MCEGGSDMLAATTDKQLLMSASGIISLLRLGAPA